MVQRGSRQVLLLSIFWIVCFSAHAQSTSFSYQGRLTDGGSPASGTYDLQLALFDASSGGTQIGPTLTRLSVAVSGGVFTVQLDFGVNAFSGASRFLEIGARAGGVGAFTILSPRQQITSTPYAIRTMNATSADGLSSACVACVQDSQISSIAGNKVSGNIPVASVPSGSTNYIQNTGSQQPSANFNISGNGTLGGRIGVGPNSPLHRLGISGGPPWTADFWGGAIDLDNASAIGWRGNTSGFRFGMGHTNAGLAFFRTASELGTTGAAPNYDLLINNSGNVAIGSPSLTPSLASKVEIFAQDGLSINGFQPFLTLNDTNSSKKSFVQVVNGDAVLLTNSRATLTVKDVSGDISITGNATQAFDKAGLAKAMVLVNADGTINLCYNFTSNLCGITVSHSTGTYDITFGFQVNSRFLSATMLLKPDFNLDSADEIYVRPISSQTVRVITFRTLNTAALVDTGFYLMVF